jgi:nucleotide-binding universal stress UspA family protein
MDTCDAGWGRSGESIVVGLDGAVASRAAVSWAANEAAESGALLRVVVVWQPRTLNRRSGSFPHPRAGELKGPDDARQLARTGAAMVSRSRGDGVRVIPEVHVGVAAEVLVAQGSAASLLVLGSPEGDRQAGVALGVVAERCLEKASVPVVLVGPEAPVLPERRIVLGGADQGLSRSAQRWALKRAARTRRVLHLVSALPARDGPGRQVAMAEHRSLMNHLGGALAGRALLTGEMVELQAGPLPRSRFGLQDLWVVDRDDRPDDHVVRPSGGPVVLIPAGSGGPTRRRRASSRIVTPPPCPESSS